MFDRANTSIDTPYTQTLKSDRNSIASTPVNKFGFLG